MRHTTRGLLAWAARRRQTMPRGTGATGPGSRLWVAQGLRRDRAMFGRNLVRRLELGLHVLTCARCGEPAAARIVTRGFGEELVCVACAEVLAEDEQTLWVNGHSPPRFVVFGDTPDGAMHRYCLPCSRVEAERTATELRASGRSGVVVVRHDRAHAVDVT